MKKILIGAAISFLIFLTINLILIDPVICSEKINKNHNMSLTQTNNSKLKLVGNLPEENVILYAKEKEGMYEDFILQVNGHPKSFKWKNISKPSFPPKLLLNDINQDKKKELVVILTTGEGTGVLESEAHVINLDASLKEIPIENPLSVVLKSTKTNVTSDGIKILTNNQMVFIPKSKVNVPPKKWFSHVVFGNITSFDIVDNKLKAYVSTQISIGGFIGNIEITYTFKDGKYQGKETKFIAS